MVLYKVYHPSIDPSNLILIIIYLLLVVTGIVVDEVANPVIVIKALLYRNKIISYLLQRTYR